MVYDPQANRRRPQPVSGDPAPVDALLGTTPSKPLIIDDPPPTPAVTPIPADPPSDVLLRNTVLAAVISGLVAALGLRQIWKRHRRAQDAAEATASSSA